MKYNESERAALDAALYRQGIDVNDQVKEDVLHHLHMVIEKNKSLNLTRITDIEQAIVLHIEDSLSIYPEFQETKGRFLDIGTGGGFPGFPLALVTGREAVLLDSVKKKADAVRDIVKCLHKEDQIEVIGKRSEEISKELDYIFNTVVARAVSSLSVLEEYASPLLHIGGRLIAMKSDEKEENILQAERVSKLVGFSLISVREFLLDGKYQRSIYVYEKHTEPSIQLPRRNGMAQKRPLGLK